ncbi:MAG: 4'-phosphopantetheinyl transferase [Candidatus Poriferisodalaceae bacterium]|jgi:4'-phosphopantetheinyl transferase
MVHRPGLFERLEHELHVWSAIPDALATSDPNWERDALTLLSNNEVGRYQRYIRPSDARLFLVAHATVRRTLSLYKPLDPRSWAFVSGEHGRPEIVNAEAAGLRFNLSHTEGLVALLVHNTIDAGIDVERVGRVDDLLQIGGTVFADSELRGVTALGDAEQQERFYRLWTLKESFIKATGKGLTEPLKDFAFDLERLPAIGFNCEPSVDANPNAWKFDQHAPSDEHFLAVAQRVDLGELPRVVVDLN